MSSIVRGFGEFLGITKPKASTVTVQMPGMTSTEKDLVALQKEYYQRMLTETPEDKLMREKSQQYLEQMMAEEQLSPDEEAAFAREYELQKQALMGQFNIESQRYGASELADLAARGMLETTTGERQIATTQQRFTGQLMSNIAEMGQAKELAKADMEAAKREMAMQGYRLTSGMMQGQIQAGLQTATNLQNYFATRNQMGANAALQNALMNQARNKAVYQQRMSLFGGLTGLGTGMAFGG